MPIEIRELVIKAEVSPDNTAAGNSSAGNGNSTPQEALIELCVEKVLQVLKEKNER
ncbi:DUF5908 family protein [Chitinophaga sp. 212800010-3]|jgi:hypothetical protein|uniref:DUF5908 family protein n=1 Tax=unclassified Chitinophaga TaxID=2619133 RepID=UPI002DF482D0|nr:Type VI secretion system protein TssL [Chitinophaga sp. 212800010-3]